jgi:uncharacterized protein
VACRQPAGKRWLIRLVRTPEGAVAVDTTGRAHGRGAYLHPDPDCLATARKRRALERALKTQVPDTVWDELGPGADT